VSDRPRRATTRDERRGTLLKAARQVFAQKGYHAATVDDVTRAAGVAKGTFYLHFQEKREIYVEVISGFLHLVQDIGRQVGERATAGPDFLTRAEEAADDLMRIFTENRDLARLAYRESMGIDPELTNLVRSFYREMAEIEAKNIQRGIDLGFLRPVNPMLVAYAHIGMVERVLVTAMDEDAGMPDTRTVVRELMQIAFEGLVRR
jgi:AcrR family transcriptional regulator